MNDWHDATDPVQRRELTEAERRRLQALLDLRRRQRDHRSISAPPSWCVDRDFDDMGA